MASTATTAESFTAMDWPMSSAAIASAMRYPNEISRCSSSDGVREVSTPSGARSGVRRAVEFISSIP
jgi:hypothetical protein